MSRLFGLRMRGDGRRWKVGVVLEAGQTDGWADARMDGRMEEVGVAVAVVAAAVVGGLKRVIEEEGDWGKTL